MHSIKFGLSVFSHNVRGILKWNEHIWILTR